MPTVMGESRYVVIAQFNVTLPNWLICRMAIFAPVYVLFRHREEPFVPSICLFWFSPFDAD